MKTIHRRRTVRGLTGGSDWRTVARGEVSAADIKCLAIEGFRARRARSSRPFEMQMEALAGARAALERNHSCAIIIFTEGEPLLAGMQQQGKLPPENDPRIQCIRLPKGGHTFRPLWIRRLAHELIDVEVESGLRQADECVIEKR